MSKQGTFEDTAEVAGGSDQGPALAPDAVAPYESMMAAIPDAEGGGYESILDQIAAATNVADLDAPWRAGGLADYADQQLIVTGLRKMPSEYSGGLPWFLVVDAVVKVSGERATFTTGAIGPVAQLVKAYALGALPVTIVPKESERKTKSGYSVWHLEFPA